MYLRHKNRDSLFIENRRCIFGGEKAPAGAHLVAPSLESTCFMNLRQRIRGSLFIKIEGGFVVEKKPLRERTWSHRA